MGIARLVGQLLDVPSLEPQERRRARLLNILVLGTAVIAVLAIVATIHTVIAGIEESREQTYIILAACLAMLVGAAIIFAINRYWSGRLASALFLLLLTIAFAFSDTPQEVISGRTTFMFAVPILIASALLPSYASFIVAALIGLLLNGIAVSADLVPDFFAVLGLFAIALVSWLTARSLEHVLDDLHAANREINLLYRSGQLFTSSLNLEQVLDNIIEELHSLLGATISAIWLRDPETSELVCRKYIDSRDKTLRGLSTAREKAIVDQAAHTSESQVAIGPPIDGHPYEGQDLQAGSELHSILCVPLLIRGEALGVIEVAGRNEGRLSDADLRLLESLAVDAAIAVENARLYELAQREIAERKRAEETLRRRNQELELLHRAGQAFSSSLNLNHVILAVLDEVRTLLRVTACSVWLTDPVSRELICQQGVGPYGEALLGWRLAHGQGLVGWVAQNGESLIAADAKADERHCRDFDRQTGWETRSVLAVPLRVRDEVTGVLQVVDAAVNRFTQAELTILEPLAASAAIAIDNARLVEGLETEVRARTAEIRAEKEKNELILNSVTDAIAMIDPQMRIRYVNPTFTTLTGYPMGKILGQSIYVLMAWESSPRELEVLQHTLATGMSWKGELTARRQDGLTYEAMMTIAPMRDAHGDLVGYVSSHWDISNQKKLDRARTGFITNVSHELRTPLTNLRLYIDLVRRDIPPERASRYLQVLEDQTNRLIALTEDVLEIAVWDSGQGISSWKPVSLSTVIEIAATGHQAQAETAGLTLAVTPAAGDLGVTKGDEARLAQALGELVENAIHFTPDGGQVTIDGRAVKQAGQDWLTISVHDTGPGIPAEEKERIFDRFYRGSLAESGAISGTGLGLCIAQEIIHAHGGKLTVASEADGGGSTFTIWLPPAP